MIHEKMSDAEIAEAVVKTISMGASEHWLPSASGHGVVIIDEASDTVRTFDPCNKVSDMWPLIIENRIGIIPAPEDGEWKAAHREIGEDSNPYYMTRDKNPLRAAAIVYLMMKEDTHG